MKKIFSFIIPIFIAGIVTVLTNNILQRNIEYLIQKKDLTQFRVKYGDFTKDKSSITKSILGNDKDLFLLGSSEMSIDVPENSMKFFPIKGAEYSVCSFGRGYVQNLQQAVALGGSNIKKGQKVAYIISLQWFDNFDGVPADKFAANFSDVQFYNFMNNPKISEENKQYYAKRVYNLLSKANKYQAEALYSKLYTSDNIVGVIGRVLMYPYYEINNYLADIKDKASIYEELKELPEKVECSNKIEEFDWSKRNDEIVEENNKMESNNQFRLKDKFYKDNIEDNLEYLKDRLVSQDATTSVEVDDFKFFLSVCNELDIHPYIIMPPVNGWYYDYLGFGTDKRYAYYELVKSLSKEYEIEVLDLREYEYSKGFLCDVMHLGREGWLKVSEGIYNHFNKR